VQEAYNTEHGITPASIVKNIHDVLSSVYEMDYVTIPKAPDERDRFRSQAELDAFIARLEREMREAAANLEFERAAGIRDRLRRLRNPDLVLTPPERS
jgi:excinuclease ABC subunit B